MSALTGEGLDAVRRAILRAAVAAESLDDTPAVANARHTALLERVDARLGEAADAGAAAERARKSCWQRCRMRSPRSMR